MVSKRNEPPAHLFLLGRFSVVQNGRESEMSGACSRLVALLGLRSVATARERIAEILWPDAQRDHAATRLRTCLHRLGPASDGLVIRTDKSLCISPAVIVDYRLATEQGHRLCDPRFTAAERDLDTAAFAHELLPGWDEDWVMFEREAFQQLRFAALESIASRCLDLARTEQAIQACLLVTRSEPLRESAHRLLARAHAADGNPAQALRQLNRYAEMLHRELGTTPSRFTIDLRQELMSTAEADE